MNTQVQRTPGFWLLVSIGIVLNILYLLGQTMAIVSYDIAVALELQEPVNEITEVGVALNKGFGFGDTFFYMPLFVLGIIGLWKRSAWGLYAMFGAIAVTIYWPMVALSTVYYAKGASGWYFTDYMSYTILLSLIALYGIWGLWFLYANRTKLVKE